MQEVLIDTSTILDLIRYFDHYKNYPFSVSSEMEAIEALIIYDVIKVDGPSYNSIAEGKRTTRYLRSRASLVDEIVQRLNDLKIFCTPIDVPKDVMIQIYAKAIDILEEYLLPVEDYRHLYEFYDQLPHHFGDDSTDIECQLNGYYPSADLEDVIYNLPSDLAEQFKRFIKILHDRHHPSRAAWALPLIRLLYYQTLQQAYSLHFVPHSTKSMIAFGQNKPASISKCIIDYFDRNVRTEFEKRKAEVFGKRDIAFPMPLVSSYVMNGVTDWNQFVTRIEEVRSSKEAVRYRAAASELSELLEQRNNVKVDEILGEIIEASNSWQKSLSIKSKKKEITVSLPFVGVGSNVEIPYQRFPKGIAGALLVFIHMLLSGA